MIISVFLAMFFASTPDARANSSPIPTCATLNEQGTYGRVASNETGECIILDSIIVTVADGYTVDQASASLNVRPGWSTKKKWNAISMLYGEYSPDNLSLDQLMAEVDAIGSEPWASHVGYDVFAGVAGQPNVAPVFTGSATHTVTENQWAGGTVSATDADDQDSVSYSIVGGEDASRFRIYSDGEDWDGLLEFVSSAALDYEAPHDADRDNRYQVRVRATSGTNDRVRTADRDITVVVVDGNDAPIGEPTVSGTEEVGEMLTAGISGIADQDGLSDPNWQYQWIRAGVVSIDIGCATGSTYRLTDPDQGKTLRVRVYFADDNDNDHTLFSENTGAIAASETNESEETGELPTPEAPAAVSSINVTHNGSSLTVTWDASARATHYDVTYYGNGINARGAWDHAGTSLTIACDSRYEGESRNCVSADHPYNVGGRAGNAAGHRHWRNSEYASP